MADLAIALRESYNKQVVVAVAVADAQGNPVQYVGILKDVGDDYLTLLANSIARFIPLASVVSIYERPEQDVSVFAQTQQPTARPRARPGAKIF